MNPKRILSFILIITMALSLTNCDKDKKTERQLTKKEGTETYQDTAQQYVFTGEFNLSW